MNNNMTKGHLAILRENYEKACTGYLNALKAIWDCNSIYGYWIGEEIGGTYSFDSALFINMDNIIYCVNNNVSRETYEEWLDYCVWAGEFDQITPNLKSWHKGCPRVDKATRDKLTNMQMNLQKLIHETKENFNMEKKKKKSTKAQFAKSTKEMKPQTPRDNGIPLKIKK